MTHIQWQVAAMHMDWGIRRCLLKLQFGISLYYYFRLRYAVPITHNR